MDNPMIQAQEQEDERIGRYNDWLSKNELNLKENWVEYVFEQLQKIMKTGDSKTIIVLDWLLQKIEVRLDNIPDWWLENQYAESFEPPEVENDT